MLSKTIHYVISPDKNKRSYRIFCLNDKNLLENVKGEKKVFEDDTSKRYGSILKSSSTFGMDNRYAVCLLHKMLNL